MKVHRQRLLKKMHATSLPTLAVMDFRLKSSGELRGSSLSREVNSAFGRRPFLSDHCARRNNRFAFWYAK